MCIRYEYIVFATHLFFNLKYDTLSLTKDERHNSTYVHLCTLALTCTVSYLYLLLMLIIFLFFSLFELLAHK